MATTTTTTERRVRVPRGGFSEVGGLTAEVKVGAVYDGKVISMKEN